MLDQLYAYLLEIQDQLLPKSESGQAVAYTLKNWTALTRYCDDPDLSIDNNHTEAGTTLFCRGPRELDLFRQRPPRQNRSRVAQLRGVHRRLTKAEHIAP